MVFPQEIGEKLARADPGKMILPVRRRPATHRGVGRLGTDIRAALRAKAGLEQTANLYMMPKTIHGQRGIRCH